MNALTLVHVVISLIAIVAGFFVVAAMIASKAAPRWTQLFLGTTIATGATGFFFPITAFTPALAVGVLSLLVLGVTLYALYVKRAAGPWRGVYVITAVFAFYLNFFVLVVQSFQKVPPLRALAPTQTEPPFAIAQGVVLLGFVILGWRSVAHYRPEAAPVSALPVIKLG